MSSRVEAETVIRTPDQRLRVFVSSTLGELAPERAAVRAAIEGIRLTPVMFELGARPHPPAELYRAYLKQSHVFVGIYWQRYGWIAPGETVSGLEDEFILSAGMPRLMYIKEPADEREAGLAQMLRRLSDDPDASYRHFATTEELGALVEDDLAILLSERFEASQLRADQAFVPARNTPPAIPPPLTPTVGREHDTDAVVEVIRSGVRLVTITGIGGVGKTRVASEVARALQSDFDEVRFVRLGDLDDSQLVSATIAAAMGVPVERSQRALDVVAAAIGDDEMLLVVDNVEQLVGAGPEFADLLDRCPHLLLLVTSRHVLRLQGEREYRLAPFAVPPTSDFTSATDVARFAQEPAVALFVEHARVVRPTFRLDTSNAHAVIDLCRRLDGLPLAIELVASRMRLLPPEDLLERLGERLLLLSSGSVDLPDRQRTLHATLDWSHRLLDPHEQALFARLAVFSGGASLDAIETVCSGDTGADVLETLASLLEKSLLVMVDEDAAGAPRVGMLQTVRTYAWEQLEATGKLAETRDRHASWYLSLAESCDPARRPGATARWSSLDAELPNIRAATSWFSERDDPAALALLASSLWTWYWITGRMSEGRGWIEGLSTRIEPPTDGMRDTPATAQLCAAVGAVRFSLGDHDTATQLFRRALEGFTAVADIGGSAEVSCMLAVIEAVQGDPSEAVELATQAVEQSRTLDLDWSLAHALTVLGGLKRQSGSAEQGRTLQLEALDIMRKLGERVSEGQILGQISLAELSEGNVSGATSLLLEAVHCSRETRHMEGMAFCLEIAAVVAFAGGQARDAAVCIGAADAIRERLNIAVLPIMQAGRVALAAALAESLGTNENASAIAEGQNADPFTLLPARIITPSPSPS